jgi:hypothetical protein
MQPAWWQRLPPPCALQCPVSPIADLVQPSSWQRLPPPCALQCCVSPRADLVQHSCLQRLPPPCVGAALQLTLPPAHGTPPGHGLPPNTPVLRPIHSHHPPPLSPHRSTSANWTPYTRWLVREQVRRWVQHVLIKVVKSAWAGDVRWVCSRAGWTGTPPHPPPPGSQAACASCRLSKP